MEEQTAVANGTAGGGGGAVRVGVLFAGRQSAGGHNIIWGLHEYLRGGDSKVRTLKFMQSSLLMASHRFMCRCSQEWWDTSKAVLCVTVLLFLIHVEFHRKR